jgi:hypothetical protein
MLPQVESLPQIIAVLRDVETALGTGFPLHPNVFTVIIPAWYAAVRSKLRLPRFFH